MTYRVPILIRKIIWCRTKTMEIGPSNKLLLILRGKQIKKILLMTFYQSFSPEEKDFQQTSH